MKLPSWVAEKLDQSEKLGPAVKLSLARFEPWLKMSGTPFFPQYTAHGTEHVEEVLASAVALMTVALGRS